MFTYAEHANDEVVVVLVPRVYEGRAVLVRFVITPVDRDTVRFEQGFRGMGGNLGSELGGSRHPGGIEAKVQT